MAENLNLKTVTTVDTRPFRKLVMTIGELPTSFIESMTYYELLAWFTNYLETVIIPTVNNNGEAVEELQQKYLELKANTEQEIDGFEDRITAAFNTLKNYVDTYFDNLDVQEEINNKLDKMAEDGTLEELIARIVLRHFIPVEYYGAVGDGVTDDTAAINNAITNAPINSVIIFEQTYKTTDTININKRLGITGGGTIKPQISASKNAFLITDDAVISDITIDGSLNTQDQFDQQSYSDLVLLTGMRFNNVKNIEINNVTIKNFYGNALQFFGYRQISITNSRIDNVGGHWYQNNTYDAFGDGLYFGGTEGESFININNCIINGKSKNTTLSRCGICVENLGESVDTYTHINLNNTKLDNYDRIIHIEAIQGLVYIVGANNNLHGNCIYNYGDVNAYKANLTLDNSILSYTGNAYSGSYGIRSYTLKITNSTIDCATRESIGNYKTNGYYSNCSFNNITGMQSNSCGKLNFNNCIFNITTGQEYIFYNSQLTFEKCTFNCDTDTVQNSSNSISNVKSCVFNKYIVRANYLDTNTVINMSGDYSVTTANKYNHHATTFYVGDTLAFRPNIASSIPCNNVERYKYETRRDVPADGTIPILPTWSENTYRPNSKYALISVGTNDWTHIANAHNFSGVYLNIITTDSNGVPSVGATQNIGTVPSGNAFTIDETNHTFARNGRYSNICISYLLEMNELNYIANYNN